MFNTSLSFYQKNIYNNNEMNRSKNPKIEDEQQQLKEKEKIDEELQLSEGSSPEPNSNEVMIPILKKNGPLLQSQ